MTHIRRTLSVAAVSSALLLGSSVALAEGEFAANPEVAPATSSYNKTSDLEVQITVIDKAAQVVNNEIKAGIDYNSQGTFNPGIINATGNTLSEAVKNWNILTAKITRANDVRVPGLNDELLRQFNLFTGKTDANANAIQQNVLTIGQLRTDMQTADAGIQNQVDDLRVEVDNMFADPRIANTAYFLLSDAEQSFTYSGNEGLQTADSHRLGERMACLNGRPLDAQKSLHATHGESICPANVGSSSTPGYVIYRCQWKRVNGPAGCNMEVVDNGAIWSFISGELRYRNYSEAEITWIENLLKDPNNLGIPTNRSNNSSGGIAVSAETSSAEAIVAAAIMKSPEVLATGSGMISQATNESASTQAGENATSVYLYDSDGASINLNE